MRIYSKMIKVISIEHPYKNGRTLTYRILRNSRGKVSGLLESDIYGYKVSKIENTLVTQRGNKVQM